MVVGRLIECGRLAVVRSDGVGRMTPRTVNKGIYSVVESTDS